jgi:hemerythrin-like domain-containing protein
METKGQGEGRMQEKPSPTRLLKEEHQATLLRLKLMEHSLQYLRAPVEETTPEHIEVERKLLWDLAFALEKGIGPHFRKEEEALFPILAEYVGKEHGLIEAMVHEHEKIRFALLHWKKVLSSLCRSMEPIDEALRRTAIDPGLRIINLIRQHNSKEDRILFEVSESSLTEEEKKEVIDRMRAISSDLQKKS